jgi:hypothetical protein
MHETETFERVKQERRDAAATVTPNTSYGSIASLAGSASINDRDKSNDSKVTQPLNNLALATSKSRYDEIKYAFSYYKWHMLGTALSWFLLDVDFYANGIFNHDVTSLVLSHGRKTTAVEDAWNSALLCCIGVPGYWLSILYLEKFGRKNVQINGFYSMETTRGLYQQFDSFNDDVPMTSPANPCPCGALEKYFRKIKRTLVLEIFLIFKKNWELSHHELRGSNFS